MKERRLLLVLAFALAVLAAALAQSDNPAATDKWKPASVTTPTSDAEAEAAGRPLAPQAPGQPTEAETAAPAEETAAPAEETAAPAVETVAPAVETVVPTEEAVAADQAVVPPDRKLWRIIPLLSAGVVFDDNIFFTNRDRVADLIWTISFGLAFELGDFRGGSENYLRVQWMGFPAFYTDNPDENYFNQAYSLLAQYRWTRLVTQLQSNFSVAREANREVNAATTTQTFSNSLRFQYDYSLKTSFDLQFSQTASVVESFENNYQYEVKAGVSYQMFPKTNLGFEGVGGILDSASSPLEYFQQARLRINYAATGKLNFKFSGGVEAREFQGSDVIKVSPVFRLGLDYRPFDGTTLNVVGYRNIVGSALIGQDITATGFEISATQRIFQKFIAGISFGYENDVFFPASGESPGGSEDRVDNYLFLRPQLRYSFVRWVSVNLFYEFRNQASTQESSRAYGNRFGMGIAASF